jgi:hypothetical protein
MFLEFYKIKGIIIQLEGYTKKFYQFKRLILGKNMYNTRRYKRNYLKYNTNWEIISKQRRVTRAF